MYIKKKFFLMHRRQKKRKHLLKKVKQLVILNFVVKQNKNKDKSGKNCYDIIHYVFI